VEPLLLADRLDRLVQERGQVIERMKATLREADARERELCQALRATIAEMLAMGMNGKGEH